MSERRAGEEPAPDSVTVEPSRARFEDPEALGAFRRQVIEELGVDYGQGVLYGAGFAEGMLDGMRVTRAYAGSDGGRALLAGAALPLVFRPEAGDLAGRFSGALVACREAAIHTATLARVDRPSCFVTAGYSAGWYSAILGATVLVREAHCSAFRAGADGGCLFEARRIDDWIRTDPSWAHALVPFIDVEAIQTRAEAEEDASEAGAEGGLDSACGALQVWGPVAVLPYAGTEDGLKALEVLRADPESRGLAVVVIDVCGTRIEGAELVRLAGLLRTIEQLALEVVLAGLEPRALALAPPLASPHGPPPVARDVAEAVALAFQLCGATRV